MMDLYVDFMNDLIVVLQTCLFKRTYALKYVPIYYYYHPGYNNTIYLLWGRFLFVRANAWQSGR